MASAKAFEIPFLWVISHVCLRKEEHPLPLTTAAAANCNADANCNFSQITITHSSHLDTAEWLNYYCKDMLYFQTMFTAIHFDLIDKKQKATQKTLFIHCSTNTR